MRRKSSSISHDYGGTPPPSSMDGMQGARKLALDGITIVAFLLLNASLK